MQGYGTEELAKEYPSLGLGIIVQARIQHGWDKARDEHTQNLMKQVGQAMTRTQLESIRFANDGIAVFHRLMGNKFRAYLRTGDVEQLGDLKDMSLRTYKEFIQLFLQLSGQDGKQNKIDGKITHHVEVADQPKTIDGSFGGSILEMLERNGGIK